MELSKRYANFVRVGSDGNMGIYDQMGNRFIRENIGSDNLPAQIALITSSGDDNDTSVPSENGAIQFNSDANHFPRITPTQALVLNLTSGGTSLGAIQADFIKSIYLTYFSGSVVSHYSGINTAMLGFPTMSGTPDLRIGVTAADASPITIFSSTSSGTRYEVKARILATAGSSAIYTISWTEGGVTQSVALTITAVDTEVHDNFVIAPDANTNITAQITSLTSSTVNVDAIVSVLG